MAQRCVLTIYEPEKDPRVVELQINPSNSGGDDRSVYNEDGTVLEDYQLFVETADNRLIKAPSSNDKSTNKWDFLKFWKRWNSEKNRVGETSSVISDVPVSENTRSYLKTYELNSSKKEKKIARIKNIKFDYAEKRLQRRLKKQRKREKKKLLINQFLSNKDRVLPKFVLIGDSVSAAAKSDVGKSKQKPPSLLDIKIDDRTLPTNLVPTIEDACPDTKSEVEKSRGKLPSLLDVEIEDRSLPPIFESSENDACADRKKDLRNLAWNLRRLADIEVSPRKRSRKEHRWFRRKLKKKMAASKAETDDSNSSLFSRVDSPSNCAAIVTEGKPKIHVRWTADEPAADFIPVSASHQSPEKLNYEITPKRWKADEPAADFIPIGASNQSSNKSNSESKHVRWRANEPAADFIPINASSQSSSTSNSENKRKKFKDSINPRTSDFIGISQKAFFLQC